MNKIVAYLQLLWLLRSPPALFSRLFELPWYRDTLEQWVTPILKPGATILEVGCAGGDFSRLLEERGMKVWAVDRSLNMLSKAKKVQSSVQFKQADASQLPFPDQHFDTVLAASLLNVVDAPLSVLSEMRRVCRKGGTVSVLVPDKAFSDANAKRYVETAQLTGLSGAAFITWHRMGAKMATDALFGYFKECGMTNISSQRLLGGMIVAVSGQRE